MRDASYWLYMLMISSSLGVTLLALLESRIIYIVSYYLGSRQSDVSETPRPLGGKRRKKERKKKKRISWALSLLISQEVSS